MTCCLKVTIYRYLALLALLGGFGSAGADPIWHCSRSDVQVANISDDFALAALSIEREVIRIALKDLYAVYQGKPVKLSGGLPLSACFIDLTAPMTNQAMNSIGVHPITLKSLTQQNSLIKAKVYRAKDEASMLACITQHQPAIGYLATPTHTEAVGPCF